MATESTAAVDAPQWLDATWRTAALSWVTARLDEHGRSVVGDVEQPHVYPWSTVFRVPTADGPVWFKANARGTAYEVPLLDGSRRLVPRPGARAARRRSQTVAGCCCRTAARSCGLRRAGRPIWPTGSGCWWSTPRCSASSPRTRTRWSRSVCPTCAPQRLPGHLADLLADEPALMIDQPDGITSDQLARLRSEQDRVRAVVRRARRDRRTALAAARRPARRERLRAVRRGAAPTGCSTGATRRWRIRSPRCW